MIRLDRLGRRIGFNWWREYICDQWRCADHAWFLQAEATAIGYATELAEFKEQHPRPTLKQTMLGLAGTQRWEAA